MILTKKQIQELLQEKGCTQREIALSLGVTEQHISMVLSGEHKSEIVLDKISRLLGIKIEISKDAVPI